MSASHFPARLKELRAAKGLTQVQLAEAAGVTKTTIASLEQGLYAPSWDTVVSLATTLGVPCDAFTQPPSEGTEKKGPGRPKAKKAKTEEDADPAELVGVG